jgi:hypothetical protein
VRVAARALALLVLGSGAPAPAPTPPAAAAATPPRPRRAGTSSGGPAPRGKRLLPAALAVLRAWLWAPENVGFPYPRGARLRVYICINVCTTRWRAACVRAACLGLCACLLEPCEQSARARRSWHVVQLRLPWVRVCAFVLRHEPRVRVNAPAGWCDVARGVLFHCSSFSPSIRPPARGAAGAQTTIARVSRERRG